MWACFNKTCPCPPFRRDPKPSFGYFSYEDEDNLEFENLLAGQDSESLATFLTRAPFANSQGYRRVANMVTPNEEASASTGRLLDDEDNLQTQDAQFLPDEQISKFTELISERGKYNQDNQEIDAQLAAEEEEVRRLEEEDYDRKRQAATEAALAKGLITPDQVVANNKNTFFTIDDDGDDGVTDSSRTVYSMNLDGDSSVELSTTSSQKNASTEEQNTSLNKPRNPYERFTENEVNEDDYDDVTDFEESPPTNSKDQTTIEDPLFSAAVTHDGVY